VDEARGLVYFTASQVSPLESHLYVVSLQGGPPRRLTQEAGLHTVCLDHHFQRFVDSHEALTQPPHLTLRSLEDGSLIRSISDPDDPRLARLALQPPEMISFPNREGVILYGAVYRPPASFGAGPHPLIVNVYGGPHVQMVSDSWRLTAAMRNQYLARLGYLVLVVDNRGSARRGLAFESALRGRTGQVEVDDQVDGVHWLVQQGLADPGRVGVYGWSYGGYMAAMCLACASQTFKVAVVGAPVTHWDGYDTHYTEHYMGLPQDNPAGYQDSSVLAHVAEISGKILLVHGLIDENVHFRHTARLVSALIRARKPYELLLFPDERHTPRRLEDRVYMEERIRDFFLHNL
jgi:dipeptidyl-peptidase-4